MPESIDTILTIYSVIVVLCGSLTALCAYYCWRSHQLHKQLYNDITYDIVELRSQLQQLRTSYAKKRTRCRPNQQPSTQ